MGFGDMKQMIGPLALLGGAVLGALRTAQEGAPWQIPTEILTLLAAALAGWVGTIARELWNRRQARAQTSVTEGEAKVKQAEARRTDAEADKTEAEAESVIIAMYRLALEDSARTIAAMSERQTATNKRLDDVVAAIEADRRAHESRGAEIEALKAEIVELRGLVEQKKLEREQQQVEIERQHDELERTRAESASQKVEIQRLNTNLNATMLELDAALKALGRKDEQIAALQQLVAGLQTEIDTIHQALAGGNAPTAAGSNNPTT